MVYDYIIKKHTLAICFTFMTYFASSVLGLIIFVHLATWGRKQICLNPFLYIQKLITSDVLLLIEPEERKNPEVKPVVVVLLASSAYQTQGPTGLVQPNRCRIL